MYLIKVGGGDTINLKGIAADLADFQEPYIIVHGANALRDKLANQIGHAKKVLNSASGYTSVYSDEAAIDLIMMAYAGLRNKRLVELLQQSGINAVGLSGLDGRTVQGLRNTGIRVRENGKLRIVRDFSGKPKGVNKRLLDFLLQERYVPVLTIPIVDENGFAINSENDDIVALLQAAYRAETILQLIEAPGFLEDRNDPASSLSTMSRTDLEQREAQVEGRMKRKMLALRKLFENGAQRVILADGRVEHPIHDALNGKGTVIA